jgi:hypothetical protein
MDQPVPETCGSQPGHAKRDGRSGRQHPFVAMVCSPLPRSEGEPMLGGEMRRDERLSSRSRMCVDLVGAFDDMSEEFFRLPFPPISGTIRVTKEPK